METLSVWCYSPGKGLGIVNAGEKMGAPLWEHPVKCVPQEGFHPFYRQVTLKSSSATQKCPWGGWEGNAEQVSLRWDMSAHFHLCLLRSQFGSAPGLGNRAARVWKGLSSLNKEETINGLFPPGNKCYLFSVALKGVKNQDCDHNRDQPVAYAHQCLKLLFWEFIYCCHRMKKDQDSPKPEQLPWICESQSLTLSRSCDELCPASRSQGKTRVSVFWVESPVVPFLSPDSPAEQKWSCSKEAALP